jgi:5-methylcytosine-specific restriction protein B
MSRYHDRGVTAILDAAATWAERCLVHDGSVFGDESLWTIPKLAELDRHFVRNLDEGTGSFLEKLGVQLAPASPAARKLMAELLWVLYLFPSNMKAPAKREAVTKVWRFSREELDVSHRLLADDVLDGIGSGGTAFFAAIWREINYAITLFSAFKALPEKEHTALVGEYERLADWLQSAPREGNRQFRHMLRYLLWPDVVERMSSNGDRHKVLVAFGEVKARESKAWTDRQIDEAMLSLRTRLATERGTDKLDFYLSPLKELWKPEESPEPDEPDVTGGEVGERTPAPYVARSAPPLNQILFGPPGTGKTYHAIDKALEILDPTFLHTPENERSAIKTRFDALVGEGVIRFVTFHQSFSYEDFVEGLRADWDDRAGALRYPVVNGVFKQLCDSARSDASGVAAPRVLIIDEINRGNVSRIFGELITLIEPSKRAGATEALEVVLPYSKQKFSVPGQRTPHRHHEHRRSLAGWGGHCASPPVPVRGDAASA